VEAKAEDPKADPDQARLMLQSLLEDRFNLKLHREMKDLSVYALAVDKGGLKMKLSRIRRRRTSMVLRRRKPDRTTAQFELEPVA
jgi:uncharacterized protein (TIGR03435 family)